MILQQILAGTPLTGKAYMLEVVAQVSFAHSVPVDDVLGSTRAKRVVRARHEAFAILHATGRFSTPQIGRLFNRDHTTVVHGLKRHRALAQQVAA